MNCRNSREFRNLVSASSLDRYSRTSKEAPQFMVVEFNGGVYNGQRFGVEGPNSLSEWPNSLDV